jgi:hypothetical protein
MRGLACGAALVLVVGGVVPMASPVVAATVGDAVMPYDFDGDGYADLTVGVAGEDLRGANNVGAVQVLYGSASGVTARDQLWHQGCKGVKGLLERQDRFGWALASGDFDGDGYADLAIGIPFENVGKTKNAGAVQVFYGSRTGLTAHDQVWHQGKPGVPGVNEEEDLFGLDLAAGDFNGDGYAELAIDLREALREDNGSVVILHGSSSGLTSDGALRLQGKGGVALGTGDVNGDGSDDLAISAPSAVHVLLGSPTGVSAAGSQDIVPADLGLSDDWRVGDTTLADFNGDGFDDLVLSSNVSSATVAVLHGHADGLHPGALPAAGTPGTDAKWAIQWWNDNYGPDVASGDLTGDGNPDLAVEIGRGVRVILGTAGGLGVADVTWPAGTFDGTEVAVLPLSGGTHAWLAVYTDNARQAGSVTVQRGAADGTLGSVEVWSQDSPGVKGGKEPGDVFGGSIGGG